MVGLKVIPPFMKLRANMSDKEFVDLLHQLLNNENHSDFRDHPSCMALLWFGCFRGFTEGIALLSEINLYQYDIDGAGVLYVASEGGDVRS
jgi:hypothetical protein